MATLKSLVDETTNIKNELVECRDSLKQILIDKKIEGLGNENRLSVLVDKVNVLSDYKEKLWLYKNGDECNSITGGWDYFTSGYANTTYLKGEKLSNCLYSKISKGSAKCITPTTINAINLKDYKYIYIKLNLSHGGELTKSIQDFAIRTSKNIQARAALISIDKAGTNTYSIDISSLTGSYYITFDTYINANFTDSYISSSIYEIWAEK